MEKNQIVETTNSQSQLAMAAICLGLFSVIALLIIGFIGYRASFKSMELSYQQFYLDKAHLLVKFAELSDHGDNQKILADIEAGWRAIKDKPTDEYICIFDQSVSLILHTAHPKTVGNYAGDNLIVDDASKLICTLKELSEAETNYAGEYISSSGQEQIVAFVPVPGKGWILGIHRSKAAFEDEIKAGMRSLVWEFSIVCGGLIPLALLLLYLAFRQAMKKRRRAEEAAARMESRLMQDQKLKAIGTLAGGIAHDFNNIISAIIGYTELAQDPKTDETMVSHCLDQLLKSAERARDLVKQILIFSRKQREAMQPVDLVEIITECLELLRATMPTTIEIDLDITVESGVIRADPIQMHQLLMNLCANAAQAMEERGGVLKVTLTAEDEAKAFRLTVTDTGEGIEPEVMDHIFDPFFTTKAQGKGTGLGLSTVHGIVTNLQGNITVESEIGQGTVFTIHLPSFEGDVEPEEKVSEPEVQGKGNILMVDDEITLIETGQLILERMGYTVKAFVDSEEAWEVFQQDPAQFDLVISDLTMPKLTGLELSAKIKGLSPDTPFIICTGYSDEKIIDNLKASGVTEIFLKPLKWRELGADINRLIDSGQG